MFARTSIRRHFRLIVAPTQNIAPFILDCTPFGPGAVLIAELSYFGGSDDGTISGSGKEFGSGQLDLAGTAWSGSEGGQPYAVNTLGVDPIQAEIEYDIFLGAPVLAVEIDNQNAAVTQVLVVDLAIQINRLEDFIPAI